MSRFKPYNYDQQVMLAIDFRRQILPGTLEWAINHIVDTRLDLSVFDHRFRNDDSGAPAFDPAIVLKIVLLAYSRGVLSSRGIQALCRENIVFMALSADSQPHFTTVARFIASMSDVIEPLFTQVLLYCDELQLIHGDMFAVDGCKLPSNAGKQHSGTFTELADRRDKLAAHSRRLLAVHARTDETQAAEQSPTDKAQRKLRQLNQQIEKIDQLLATGSPRRGAKGREVKSNTTDNDSAKMATSHGVIQGYNGLASVDATSQIVITAQAIGQGPENDRLMPMLDAVEKQLEALGREGLANHTAITADSGFNSAATLQALEDRQINATIADKDMRERDVAFADRDKHKTRHRKDRKRQAKHARANQGKAPVKTIFGPDDFDYDRKAGTCHCPAGHKLYSDGSNTTLNGHRHHRFRGSLTICQPCPLRQQCLTHPDKTPARQVSIKLEKRAQSSNTPLERMKARIDSPAGRAVYSQRLGTVEPVFGNHRNHGRERFTLRGRKKVNAQWQLYNLVHNIGKLHSSGKMAA